MKRIILCFVIVFGLTIAAHSQTDASGGILFNGGGLFQFGAINEEYSLGLRDVGLFLPDSHGIDTDVNAPLGGGIFLLMGFGAAYALKKKKEEK